MKNNVKRIMALFLCLVCLVGIVSCGGPMPETDIPKADDTPVEDITPLPPEAKPEEITAEEAYRLIYDEIIKYMSVSVEKNITYLSLDAVENATSKMSVEKIIEQLGTPHFLSLAWAPSGSKCYGTEAIYVIEDGTVLYLGQSSKKEEVTRLKADEMISLMKANWEKALTVPIDPQTTYEQLYADMANRKYMHISDRTDFVDANVAKELPIFIFESENLITVDEMIDKLGQPHFMQAEEERRPGSSTDRATFYVYVLNDGTVLNMCGSYGADRISDIILHYTVTETLDYYSRAMYY